MKQKVSLDAVYAISEDVVARDIEGELIIVPLVAGIGDAEDELFTLNDTGRAIWERLDGKKSLRGVTEEMSAKYKGSFTQIQNDVLGLVNELLKRKMLVKVSKK